MKIIIAATIITLLTLVIVLSRLNFSAAPPSPNNQSVTQPTWLAQTRNEGEVAVTVEPLDIFPQAQVWSFKITLNTHTVELNEDLLQSAFLESNGKNLQLPLGWEGDPPGGHHRQGVLSFQPLKTLKEGELTLILKDIGGLPERKFTWKEVKK